MVEYGCTLSCYENKHQHDKPLGPQTGLPANNLVFLFAACSVPFGHKALVIHGFVEELVVNDDPEYQWIDKIRTPRSSNEARQRLFTKLSGQSWHHFF